MVKKIYLSRKEFFVLAFITFCLIFIPRTLPVNINPWMMLQWNTTYENGFVYRGLIGSILEIAHPYLCAKYVFIYGIINVIVYFVFLLILVNLCLKNNQGMNVFLFLIFLLAQPFVTQWYMTSTMFQRLDVILNILFIICIILIVKIKPKQIYPLLFVISSIGLLVHEGFAVYSIPTLFSFIVIKEALSSKETKPLKAFWRSFIFYLLPIIIFYILILFLGKPKMPLNEFYMFLQHQIGEVGIPKNDVYSIFYMPLREKVVFTMEHYCKEKIINLVLTILFMSPSIYVFFILWKEIFKNSQKKIKFVLTFMVLSTFSTAIAFFIAVDIMRWLGYIVFNNVFALIFIYLVGVDYASVIIKAVDRMKYFIVFAIVLSIILGPTQWMNGFAIIGKIINIFSDFEVYLLF